MKPLLKKIKRTYICKDVKDYSIDSENCNEYKPLVGDVAVFEVIEIGKHQSIQGVNRRNITIVPGDLIMGAFGTRYATEQFEGYVPEHVNMELHILGAGGTVGKIASMHDRFEDIGPTTLRFAGFVKNRFNQIVNTKAIKQKQLLSFSGSTPAASRIVLSLGSSMDSGKTTSAAYLIHGLKESGYNVAYVKLTGTVYTKDCDLATDLGADAVSDFSDFGYPSTYMCDEEELLDLYESCISVILKAEPDFVIMEIADGLYQRETKLLLNSSKFKQTIDSVIFSANDSLAAISGVKTLNDQKLYPAFLSGLFTCSPLLIREVQENTTVPVFTREDLLKAEIACNLFREMKVYTSNL